MHLNMQYQFSFQSSDDPEQHNHCAARFARFEAAHSWPMLMLYSDLPLQVKLIVIDSIAFHFRQDFQDMAQRTRVLAEMAQKLMSLAEERDLAV